MAKAKVAEKWIDKVDKAVSVAEKPHEQLQNAAVWMTEEYGEEVFIFRDDSSAFRQKDYWTAGDDFIHCPYCEQWRIVDLDAVLSANGTCSFCWDENAAVEAKFA